MEEIIQALKEVNSDNSRFLINIIKAQNSFIEDIKNKQQHTKINLEKSSTNLKEGIVNLDEISADKYYYTKMKLRRDNIIELLKKTDIKMLSNKKILNSVIFCEKEIKSPIYEQDKMDIVELIKEFNKNNITSIKMVASSITELNLFKEEQINMALEIIKNNNFKERISKLYDIIYNYLQKDFIANNYCDFIKDKCVAQRRFHLYPLTQKDGCCFMNIRKCTHLNNGQCDTECIACRLFSCPYLTKRGIGYYANEFILLKAFLDKEQRRKLVFEFYKSKEEILKQII